MGTDNYKELIARSSFGYAFHRLILDENGVPADYEFIEVNEAFVKLSGLKKENILGRRVRDISFDNEKDLSRRIRLYGHFMINNESGEFEYHSLHVNRWYRVQVYPQVNLCFSVLYFDITDLKQTEMELRDSTMVLGEKVMEMNLLIQLSQMIHKKGITLHDIFRETVIRIPLAFMHPDVTSAVIKYGGNLYSSEGFRESSCKLSVELYARGRSVGVIEIYYLGEKKSGDNALFMKEEQVLVSTIARYLEQFIEKIESDEELKNSRAKLVQYMNYAPDGIFITDINGCYKAVNPAACRLLGYTEDELLHMSIPDITPSEVMEQGMNSFRNLLETGRDKSEITLLKKDHGRVWVALDAVSLPDGTFMGFCKDISDRKKVEKELIEFALFNKTLLNTIPAPVFYKDINGRFLGINSSFAGFYGRTEDEMTGRTVFDVAPHNLAEIYREKDKELLQDPGIQVYETQVSDAGNNIHDVIFHKATFNDAAGNTGGIIGVILDITERKKAEKELELYFRAIQSIDQPVLITDNEGNIIRVNNAFVRMYGYTPEELYGINPRILNPGKDVYLNFGYTEAEYEKLFKSMWDSISNPDIGTWEDVVINRKKDGSLIWVKLLINTVYSDEHSPRNYIALPMDITSSLHNEAMTKIQLYQTIAALAELRDNETGNHMRRVGIFAKLLAREYNMPEKYCNDIEIFAPLHDIGKVGIIDSILLAERKLTLEENEIMKTHTILGHNIVEGKKELEMVAAITIGHHEWYNGGGYPLGLKGEDISLSARITAIADVYDALRSSRPYKDEWNHDNAKNYILYNSGKQFDPGLLEIFEQISDRFENIYFELKD